MYAWPVRPSCPVRTELPQAARGHSPNRASAGGPRLHHARPAGTPALRTNITIQVMPMSASAHPGLLGLFSVVNFEKPWPAVVQLETILGGTFVEATEQV
ncbi:Scr1 family TA system antitoxin-like transcriptional regulator [Streptomyces sp. NBC_00091]|nr:Scr1 family TA system antitoxin-like transcriptional regulator [Streptomyces sp. NBC_00091]MCX5374891.1 DUF5753 domain-containing protein [Streptomyces sp. NBC_00091]MCX5380276.1 DUF5753 domain-containing protein [Streptomyces sp. NBC_00091]